MYLVRSLVAFWPGQTDHHLDFTKDQINASFSAQERSREESMVESLLHETLLWRAVLASQVIPVFINMTRFKSESKCKPESKLAVRQYQFGTQMKNHWKCSNFSISCCSVKSKWCPFFDQTLNTTKSSILAHIYTFLSLFCACWLFDIERLNSVQVSTELHCADTIVMRIHRTTGKADHSSRQS